MLGKQEKYDLAPMGTSGHGAVGMGAVGTVLRVDTGTSTDHIDTAAQARTGPGTSLNHI